MNIALTKLARSIKALTYDETEALAYRMMGIVHGRADDDDMALDPDNIQDWMRLIQDWAEAELDEPTP